MVTTDYIGDRHSAGVGYVIIPSDVDREQYIRYCFNTCSLSISLENGGALHNVQCIKQVFNDIDFPIDSKTMGSMVFWVDNPLHNHPTIIGTIPKVDQDIDLSEKQSSFSKTSGNGTSEILLDSKQPSVTINCDSLTEAGGDIIIVSKNKALKSKIKINSSGEITLSSQNFDINTSNQFKVKIADPFKDDNVTTIIYKKGEGLNYSDEFGNEIQVLDGKVNINSDNINIGGDDAKQPILLGDDTGDLIDKILEILSRTQTTTLIGPQPLLTAAEFAGLRAKVELIKSTKHRIE